MSYEFTKLSNVPVVSEFPEGANAVIETNGEIKRCPSSGSGGGVVEFITLTQSGETFIANKNSEEIIALMDSGKLPILIIPPEALAAQEISTAVYTFPIAQDGTSFIGIAGFTFLAAYGCVAVVDSSGATTITFGG